MGRLTGSGADSACEGVGVSELSAQIERMKKLIMLTGKIPTVLDVDRETFEKLVTEMAGSVRYTGTNDYDGRPSGIYTDQVKINDVVFGCIE